MKKKKFNTFHDFVLNDEKIVMKVLMVMSLWAGNILFSLTVVTLLILKVYDLGIILGVIALFGWYYVFNFYRIGGTKAMPDMSTNQVVWRKNNGKEKKNK
jgi:hypothetical protein